MHSRDKIRRSNILARARGYLPDPPGTQDRPIKLKKLNGDVTPLQVSVNQNHITTDFNVYRASRKPNKNSDGRIQPQLNRGIRIQLQLNC
jgi:hypothetical protein